MLVAADFTILLPSLSTKYGHSDYQETERAGYGSLLIFNDNDAI